MDGVIEGLNQETIRAIIGYKRGQAEKMVTKTVSIRCPHCGSEQVSKNGHNKAGKQRYLCNNPECQHRSFVEEYTNRAWDPKVREQVLKLAIDCTGTRATGRILGIAKDSVTAI